MTSVSPHIALWEVAGTGGPLGLVSRRLSARLLGLRLTGP